MPEEFQINSEINPLEPSWSFTPESTPTAEEILAFVADPRHDLNPENFKNRAQELRGDFPLFIVPFFKEFSEKLVIPLRHAKSSYMLGNYLGTIALCGMVAEMLAIFLFEISEMKESEQQQFERFGQTKRVRELINLKIIDQEIQVLFDNVREIRRKYLHYYSQEHENIRSDAREIFIKTQSLIVKGIDLKISAPGKVSFSVELVRFLTGKGIAKKTEDESSN